VDIPKDVTVAQVDQFDEVIDVRSPGEFALDRIEDAINCPVLNDEEREVVGTLYKQASPFEARRIGAAMVARNIARHLESTLRDRDRNWRPLVYCWRGGGRSDSLCDVLRRIGWRAAKLAGGYKAYRQAVIADLAQLPVGLHFEVLCGRTGAGKSRVLQALAAEGAQVLDLEQLACHRGSVLGELPGIAQPSQKMFESKLWWRLRALDPKRAIFVESESRKIGNLQIPQALIAAIRAAPCIVLVADTSVRVALLLDEYAHLLRAPDMLKQRLDALSTHYGREKISCWKAMATAGDYGNLVDELLTAHYDPAYDRSIERNFPAIARAPVMRLRASNPGAMRELARALLEQSLRSRVRIEGDI